MRHLVVPGTLLLSTVVGCYVGPARYRARATVMHPTVAVSTVAPSAYFTVQAPPPPMPVAAAQVQAVQPSAGHVWIDGYWAIQAGAWVWIEGHWEVAQAGAVWEPPVCAAQGGQYQYHQGYWRASTEAPPPVYRAEGTIQVHWGTAPVRRVQVGSNATIVPGTSYVEHTVPHVVSGGVVQTQPTPVTVVAGGATTVHTTTPTVTVTRPTATVTTVPGGVTTVRPTATATVQTQTVTAVRPTATATVQTHAVTAVRPTATATVQTQTVTAVRPTATATVQTHAVTAVRPTATATVQTQAVTAVRPTVTATVQAPTATTAVGPAATTTTQGGVHLPYTFVGRGTATGIVANPSPSTPAVTCAPSGPRAAHGSTIHFQGQNLSTVTQVFIGGAPAQITGTSTTQLRVQAPASGPGGSVVVMAGGASYSCGAIALSAP